MEKIAKRARFPKMWCVEPEGIAGGLSLFCKDNFSVDVFDLNKSIIDVAITDPNGVVCRFTGVYASTDASVRKTLWRALSEKACGITEPWVLMGDFNCILSNEEKSGGEEKADWEMADFRNFVWDNGLIDIGYVGYPFTWNNRRSGRENVRERLDRALVNSRWRVEFDSGFLRHLGPGGSDHCPILLHSSHVTGHTRKRFIFDSRWTTNLHCETIIKNSWRTSKPGSKWYVLQGKIKHCRRKLRSWRASGNLNSRINLQELEKQLESLYEADDFDGEEYKSLENKLKEASREEERYWRDKSRTDWLKLGDKNTSFFHAKTVQRRAQNRIRGLENENGIWMEGENEVENIVLGYFTGIFTSSNPYGFDEVLSCVQQRVSPVMNARLTRQVTAAEVKEALFQMPPSKSPGPDGMTEVLECGGE
ncbi:hypothetical protein Vadar_001983 [Vaccinium darrowii]|uniref:Uncharacterized protein n=1 Tax=Vaccinium darrowii TaxID=229202 RepID=A0ACB7YID7_9ERIC|nr:hypothetical protein Vadar_001983 [Vaccinium darrowii]